MRVSGTSHKISTHLQKNVEALGTPGLPRFFRFWENSSQTVVRGRIEREKSLGERGADFGERKAQTLGFVPLIGHPCDLRKELLFFFVCTGPLDIVLLTELEEDFVEPFFLWVMAAIPGGVGRNYRFINPFHSTHTSPVPSKLTILVNCLFAARVLSNQMESP